MSNRSCRCRPTPQPQQRGIPSCIFDRHHSSWQHQMPSPLSEARDRTRNLMVPSRICFHCAMMGTPRVSFEKVITWVVPHDPTARGLSPSSRLGLGAQSLLSPERLLSISPASSSLQLAIFWSIRNFPLAFLCCSLLLCPA